MKWIFHANATDGVVSQISTRPDDELLGSSGNFVGKPSSARDQAVAVLTFLQKL